MALYGGLVFGPAATTWFGFLARRINFPTRPNLTIAARVLTDQTVFASTNLFCFLSSMAIMEGGSPQEKLNSSYWSALKMNWVLWPAVQGVNFRFVPLEHRVLVVNVVSLGELNGRLRFLWFFPFSISWLSLFWLIFGYITFMVMVFVRICRRSSMLICFLHSIGWNCYLSYVNSQGGKAASPEKIEGKVEEKIRKKQWGRFLEVTDIHTLLVIQFLWERRSVSTVHMAVLGLFLHPFFSILRNFWLGVDTYSALVSNHTLSCRIWAWTLISTLLHIILNFVSTVSSTGFMRKKIFIPQLSSFKVISVWC